MSKKKTICCVLFIGYCYFILWITVLKSNATVRECEWGLFWGLRMLLNNEPNGLTVFIQYINNILFFIPFGFPLGKSYSLEWKQIFIAGFIASSFVEITQYITARGLAEIDDVISNTVGAMSGFVLWKMKNRLTVNKEKV